MNTLIELYSQIKWDYSKFTRPYVVITDDWWGLHTEAHIEYYVSELLESNVNQ